MKKEQTKRTDNRYIKLRPAFRTKRTDEFRSVTTESLSGCESFFVGAKIFATRVFNYATRKTDKIQHKTPASYLRRPLSPSLFIYRDILCIWHTKNFILNIRSVRKCIQHFDSWGIKHIKNENQMTKTEKTEPKMSLWPVHCSSTLHFVQFSTPKNGEIPFGIAINTYTIQRAAERKTYNSLALALSRRLGHF